MFETCPHCGKDVLMVREPVYQGLKKVGETVTCSACKRKVEGGGAVGAKAKADPLSALFGDDAEPEKLDLFDVDAETGKMCRKCTHYVLHPFTQRCGLHDREVQATDSCPDFEAAG